MTTQVYTNPTPNVNSQPYRITCGGRGYWQSVTRACGHDELVPIDDRGVDAAHAHATRADIPCFACRRADWEAQRVAAPNLLANRPARPNRPARSGSSNHASKPRADHRPRRRRHTPTAQELIGMQEALDCYNDFLDAVAAGLVEAATATITKITRKRDTLARQLRAHGIAA